MYEIIFSKISEKCLDKLNQATKERIINFLEKIKIRPHSYLVRLVGENLYKFRVGDYRLIIELKEDKLLILVVDLGHRKNI